jgi:S-adenosylmethionine decarboxylase
MKTIRQPGLHLFLTLSNCDEKRLLWKEGIYKLLRHMPKKVDMNLIPIANNPILNFCNNPNIEEDVGYTGIAVLWESHFSIHTWSYYNEVDIDLFSCKEFDYSKVIKVLTHFFKGTVSDGRVISRGFLGNIDILI